MFEIISTRYYYNKYVYISALFNRTVFNSITITIRMNKKIELFTKVYVNMLHD